MIDHFGFVAKDLAGARRFYDAIAKPLGLATADNTPESFVLGKSKEEPIPFLWIGTQRPNFWTKDSQAGASPLHFAFGVKNRAAVDAFYKAALAAGGKDNGPPGTRETMPHYYGAFVIDPDGNNVEACVRE